VAGPELNGAELQGEGGDGPLIAIGADLCSVSRMRAALSRTPTLADRVFTREERAYCERRRDPAERYAARFAAKEAVLKAMGAGLGACSFREIEVRRAESGAPSLVLHGAAVTLAAGCGVHGLRLSLSHDRDIAFAVVVALGATHSSDD
jgi:holo-[acyl-carrier protein] synthase